MSDYNGVVYHYFKKEIAKNLLTIHYFSAILLCANRLQAFEKTAELSDLIAAIRQDTSPFKALAGKISGVMMEGTSDLDLLLDYLKIITLYDFSTYSKAIALLNYLEFDPAIIKNAHTLVVHFTDTEKWPLLGPPQEPVY